MSCTLTIGYGLYTPVDSNDLVVTMMVIFAGAIIFALTVSQLIAMMDQINVGSLKFKVTRLLYSWLLSLIEFSDIYKKSETTCDSTASQSRCDNLYANSTVFFFLITSNYFFI